MNISVTVAGMESAGDITREIEEKLSFPCKDYEEYRDALEAGAENGWRKRCGAPLSSKGSFNNMGSGICVSCWIG